jgi:hypothetical protein
MQMARKITIYTQIHEACINMERNKIFLHQAKITHYFVRGIFQDVNIYETENKYRTTKISHNKGNPFK